MNSKWRIFFVVGFVLILTLSSAACGGQASPVVEEGAVETPSVEAPSVETPSVEEPITLRYQSFTAEGMAIERELLEEYESLNPGVQLEIEPCPAFECYDKVVLSHEAGNSPDIYMGWWTFDVASAGLALNLDPYIERAGGQEFVDRYVPAAFAMGEKDGSIYSLPWRTGGSVLYMNLNLLEAAGLDLPEQGWTWDDFRDYAIAMTNPEEGQYGFALSGAPTDTGVEWEYWSFLIQNGGAYLKDNRAAFNGPEGVEALQFLVDLIHEDNVVHPGIAEMDVSQVLDLLAADKVAMWVEGPWYINDLRSTYPESNATLVFAPEKVHDGGPAGGTSLMISPDTEHPQEAFDFISWMTAKEQVSRWASGAAFLPAAVGSDTDEAFQSQEMQVAIQTTLLPNTRTANLYPENNNLNTIIRNYLIAAYLQDMEPQEALDQAAEEWNQTLAQYYP